MKLSQLQFVMTYGTPKEEVFIISVAAYLRSLWIRAAEEKNIPRPSSELMNCK